MCVLFLVLTTKVTQLAILRGGIKTLTMVTSSKRQPADLSSSGLLAVPSEALPLSPAPEEAGPCKPPAVVGGWRAVDGVHRVSFCLLCPLHVGLVPGQLGWAVAQLWSGMSLAPPLNSETTRKDPSLGVSVSSSVKPAED